MSQESHRIEVSYKAKSGKTSVFIVLLHGLDGDEYTFVNSQSGVSLQQLLSKDIPSATILTYIYPNSSLKKFFIHPPKKGKRQKSTTPSDTIKARATSFLKLLLKYISSTSSSYTNDDILSIFVKNQLFKMK